MTNDPRYRGLLSAEQIKLLVTIAKRKSFNQASIALGVHQPAVTQQVRRLEKRLGRRLFERTAAGVRLTNDGEAVLIYAQAMMSLSSDLTHHLGRSTESTTLRLGLNEDFARSALPAVLALLIRDFPNVHLKATSGTSSEVFAALDEGDVDVVVTRVDTDKVRGELLWSAETVWQGRADTRLPADAIIPLVVPVRGGLRNNILAALHGASRSWRIVFESTSLVTMEAAMRAGLGIGAFTQGPNIEDVVELDAERLALPLLPLSSFVIDRSETADSPVIEVFCKTLRVAAQLSFQLNRQASPSVQVTGSDDRD